MSSPTASAASKSGLKHKLFNMQAREKWKDFLCILPALALLSVFVYYPIVEMIRLSFTNIAIVGNAYEYVGFKNYEWLFLRSGQDYFVNSLWVTLKYTFFEVAATIVFGVLLAMLFNRDSRSFGVMRAFVFMPKYIAMAIASVVFIWILHGDYGILNVFLNTLGFESINWLTSERHALYGVLILTCWRAVGYSMMLYLSSMRGISRDYYEASSLDGATKLQQFRYITVPLLSPITLFIFVTTFISAMKIFQSIDVMTNGGPYNATNVMVYWIYKLGFQEFRVDRASAVSTIFFIIILVCTVLTMKASDKNVHYDS